MPFYRFWHNYFYVVKMSFSESPISDIKVYISFLLTYFMLLFSFYTPGKKKSKGFLVFSGGIEIKKKVIQLFRKKLFCSRYDGTDLTFVKICYFYVGTSQLICNKNQLIGFHMIGELGLNQLNHDYSFQ